MGWNLLLRIDHKDAKREDKAFVRMVLDKVQKITLGIVTEVELILVGSTRNGYGYATE